MTEWEKDGVTHKRSKSSDLGGTMRLGSYECVLEKETLAAKVYKQEQISERHRHRYEMNIGYAKEFAKAGLKISGLSPSGKLPEIVELKNHPWFIGVQFHPELKSRPFAPHPLFYSFVEAAIKQLKIAL